MGSGIVESVSFSGCGEYIASGSRDKTVRIWAAKNGTCEKVLEGHRYLP
jgi:WD40 repeat protein